LVSEDPLQRSGRTGRRIHEFAEFRGVHGSTPRNFHHLLKKSRQAPAMSKPGITLNAVSSCRQAIFFAAPLGFLSCGQNCRRCYATLIH